MRKAILAVAMIFTLAAVPAARLHAQQSLSVTVTPPLYQLTIGPGESWATTLKIVNNNPYDVTFYAEPVDMEANGEDGRSKFIPLINEKPDDPQHSYQLARWITITSGPILVKADTSQDVPFDVEIPQNAEPGGHYAAILVGTQPGGLHATGTVLEVSSYVSSLLFVRIKGDVNESGRIREFLTTNELYQTPDVDFTLRFENTGNTHVIPRGDVTIYNMWGKERGKLAINQDADFGNVLPHSIRRFDFSWHGDPDLFDIGLYRADVTLSFGDEGKQNTSSSTYFWVVPIIPVSVGLGSILLGFLLLIWFIRRYIRRALELEQRRMGIYTPLKERSVAQRRALSAPSPKPQIKMREALIEPIREGVVDLRSVANKKQPIAGQNQEETSVPVASVGQLVKKYWLFGAFVILIIVTSSVLWLYFHRVLVKSRGFQITDIHIQEESASSTPSK